MSYIHSGIGPVVTTNDEIDPDSTDEVYFVLGGATDANDVALAGRTSWLKAGESVTTTSAIANNATVIAGPTLYSDLVEQGTGNKLSIVYGIQFTPGATGVAEVTLRVSTDGGATAPRLNVDFTAHIRIRNQ